MRAQLFEAASSLTSFVQMSKKPRKEVDLFKHKIVRLTSMLHALALCVIANQHDKCFPIIDIESVPDKYLETLASRKKRQKTEVVYQWLNHTIIHALDTGVLNIPPPILSRVFQELEKAMVEYNQVLQIMTIAFPFPYAQVSVVMIWIYMMTAPFVMVHWTSQPIMAFAFTFLSTACFLSLEMIAAELENPFGDDDNDLPCAMFQEDINDGLVLLLAPSIEAQFELGPKIRTHQALLDKSTWHSMDEEMQSHHIKMPTSYEEVHEEWSDEESILNPIDVSQGEPPKVEKKTVQPNAPAAPPVGEPKSPDLPVSSEQIAVVVMGREEGSRPEQSPAITGQIAQAIRPATAKAWGPLNVSPEQTERDAVQVSARGNFLREHLNAPVKPIVEPKLVSDPLGSKMPVDVEVELVNVLKRIQQTLDQSGGWLSQIHNSLTLTPMVRLAESPDHVEIQM
jgi:predicted membrane chloride channel (bestrophin family)